VFINGIRLTETNGEKEYIDGRFFACFSPDFPNVLKDEAVAFYQPGLSGFDVRLYDLIVIEGGWGAEQKGNCCSSIFKIQVRSWSEYPFV